VDGCPHVRVFTGARGSVLRRSNFARRFWRPAWDGDPGNSDPQLRTAPVLKGFTFHEGRHTQRTWLAEDGIPDVARAARLGHRLPGMADVYEHVTPAMEQAVLDALQARWEKSVAQLTDAEHAQLLLICPPSLHDAVAHLRKPVDPPG
jgi:integrase